MSERSNVLAWKAGVVKATSGSNPDFCAKKSRRDFFSWLGFCKLTCIANHVCKNSRPRLAPDDACPSVESALPTANPDFCAMTAK